MQRQGGFPESGGDPFPTNPIRVPRTRPDEPEQPTADPTADTEALPVQHPPSDRPRAAAENVEPADTYHGNWTDWVYPEPADEQTDPGNPERNSGTPVDNYPLTEDSPPPATGASEADPPTDRFPRVDVPSTADHTAASDPATAPPWHRPATEQQHTAPPMGTSTGQQDPAANHRYRDDRAAEVPSPTPQGAAQAHGAPASSEPPQSDPDTQRPLPSPEGKAALDRLRQQRPPETTEPMHGYRQPGQRRWVPPVLGTMGAAALFAAAYVQFGGSGDARDIQPAEPTAADARASTVAAPLCTGERDGNSLQGNGAGGDGSGTETIFAFQHAYYVDRSAEQARESVAADAAVPPAPDIQQGIDTIPMGTTHCLSITPGAFVGQYTVVITEHRPDAAPISYNPQLVTTEDIGGRTVITGIGPMP